MIYRLANLIPILFCLVATTWLIAGSFDLHLLGFSREWSFYAALHGFFLGFMFTSCLVTLSKKNRLYLWGCYLTLVLFLSVAFGINGVPYIKRVGVIGFALLMPFLIGHYTFHLSVHDKRSRYFSLISLSAIVLSMALAVLNEFWLEFPRELLGLPTMVLTHGLLNAFVAIPFFYLAIKMERS